MRNHSNEQHIVVLGGSFNTGKSNMLEQIKSDFGSMFTYILDSSNIIQDLHNPSNTTLSLNELQRVQREILEYYIAQERAALKTQKTVISDGSLVEVAAYSQFILEPKDFQRLNGELQFRSFKNIYNYVKFPVQSTPDNETAEYQNLIDKRIDRVLAKNSFDVTTLIGDNFCGRYAQILSILFQ